jgi:alpha-glucosidase
LTADDAVSWRVGRDRSLVAERASRFTVVVAMGDGPVRLPAGTLMLSTSPLTADGRLAPDSAAWLLHWTASP